jgi:NAD(P)-dependent dehydrogenase (short-subunit alcohol dehydrogenase family)
MAYPASKAAVSMLTVQYARAYPELRINVVDPGPTATDLNGFRGFQSVEQGAAAIVRAAQFTSEGPTGCFLDADGVSPW